MLRPAFFTGLTSSDYNWMLHEQRTGSLHIIHTMQDFFFQQLRTGNSYETGTGQTGNEAV